MTLRQYGAGALISAALSVTGVLWWQRANPYVAGEDEAALAADSFEVYNSHVWRDTDAWSPNRALTITSWIVRTNLMTMQGRFRALASAYSGVTPTWGARVLVGGWPHTNGTTLLTYNYAGYTNSGVTYENNPFANGQVSNRIWELTSRYATNATPTYVTLCTRIIGPEYGTRQYDQADTDARNKHIPAAFDYVMCPVTTGGAAIVSADYVPYGTNWNWWTDVGWGTNVWIWPGNETVISNKRVQRGWTMQTNDLNNIRFAHNSVTQSIMVYSAHLLNGYHSEVAKYYVRGSASSNESSTVGLTTFDDLDTLIRQKAVTNCFSGSDEWLYNLYVATNAYGATEPRCARVTHYGLREEQWTNGVWKAGSQKMKWSYSLQQTHIKAPWPSDSVCASGLVSRIRTYAVYVYNPLAIQTINMFDSYPGSSGWPPGEAYFTGESFALSDYEGDAPDGILLSRYPDRELNSGINVWSQWRDVIKVPSITQDLYAQDMPDGCASPYNQAPNIFVAPSEWVLTELSDVSNPTSRPIFTVGSLQTNYIQSLPIHQKVTWDETFSGVRYIGRIQAYSAGIYIYAIVTVVDWNYTRYADGGTNNVAPFTPEWLL